LIKHALRARFALAAFSLLVLMFVVSPTTEAYTQCDAARDATLALQNARDAICEAQGVSSNACRVANEAAYDAVLATVAVCVE